MLLIIELFSIKLIKFFFRLPFLSPVSTRHELFFDNIVTQSMDRDVIFFPGAFCGKFRVCQFSPIFQRGGKRREREKEKFIVSVRHKHSWLSLVNFAFPSSHQTFLSSFVASFLPSMTHRRFRISFILCHHHNPPVSTGPCWKNITSQKQHFHLPSFLFLSTFPLFSFTSDFLFVVGVCVCKSRCWQTSVLVSWSLSV